MVCGCMTGSSVGPVSGDKSFKLVERSQPSALVSIARGLIEQLLVGQREQRAVTVRLQRDRDQRFAFRGRMPGPAEHQFLVRNHLAVDTANFVVLVIGGEADAVTAAGPRVDLRLKRARLGVRASEPADYFFRVGPRGVDFRRRRIETTFEGEAMSSDDTGIAGGAWL